MAELKDVVESILTDLTTVRHNANKFSQSLSAEYLEDGELSNFSAPAVDIGNVKLEIKFVLEEPEGEVDSRSVTLESNAISKIIRDSAAEVLGSNSVKYKAASNDLANRKNLYSQITAQLIKHTNSTTLKINKNQALNPSVDLLRPHLARDDSARPVTLTDTRRLINKLIVSSEAKLSRALDAAKKAAVVKPKFIVDIKKLKAFDPAMIATISLDLDLFSMELPKIVQD